MFSGVLEEKWRKKRRTGWAGPAIASEAKRLALGTVGFRSYVEIMDFEGNVLGKFRTKNMRQIQITSDVSQVYLLSAGGKIFAYNSNGEKLKKYKCREWIVAPARHLSISEDGSVVTAGDALMDAEGDVIHFSDGKHMVIDAFSRKPEQKGFFQNIVGIAPNGTYIVVHESSGQTRQFFKGTSLATETVTYQLNHIYIRPQDTNTLLGSKEKQGSQQWTCVPFNLNTDMGSDSEYWFGAKVCVHNSFFASARKSIGYIDLNGNLKWAFTLHHRDEIRQFYVTPDAKYVFFTLKGRKKKKNIYILDAENRNVMVKALQNRIDNFKVTNDGKILFACTSSMTKAEIIAFDVRRKLLQQISGG